MYRRMTCTTGPATPFWADPTHGAEVHGTSRAAATLEHFPPGFEIQVHVFLDSKAPHPPSH